MNLTSKRPLSGDAAAREAHKLELDAALLIREEAEYAARVYLGEHPEAVPAEARRVVLEAAARELGAAGYKVVPLWPVDVLGQCTCKQGHKCGSAGKHPIETGWQDSATTDPRWWSNDGADAQYPQANIGVVLEEENSFVLDMDPDNGGDVTLQQIQERLGDNWDMPPTVIVQTGSAAELAESGNTGVGRNNTLNKTAYALGQLAPMGITVEAECRALLYEAASKCGMHFVNDGVEATFDSGWRSGLKEPFWPDWAEEDEAGAEYPARTWDGFGLGDRLVDRFAETLRWAPTAGRWMSWQSGRWEMDDKDAGMWMARPMIESMVDEEDQYDDEATIGKDGTIGDSPRKKFRKWVRSCRNPNAMGAAATVAKANALMRIDLERCDSNPLWINTRNGVYDAATGAFHEHDPSQLLTMKAAVRYDPQATCPRWDAFMEQVQPEKKMREYLYRCWGYSATGDTSEQSLFINHGGGANGKSVVNDVLSMILGDYAQVVPIETLLTSRNKQGRIPNDVARMMGKRFLKSSETSEGRRLDEALLKSLTGGEELVARFMRAEYFQFRMLGKIHLTSNFLTHIGDDDATWRRLHLIPWLVTIPKEDQDKYLAAKLYAEEASGIFNRLLAGLADWRDRGALSPPDTATKAVEAYRKNEDTLAQAIGELFTEYLDHTECTSACRSHLIYRSGEYLYNEYQRYAGKEAMGRTTFYAKLESRGYVRSSYKRKTLFPQLSVKADEADEA